MLSTTPIRVEFKNLFTNNILNLCLAENYVQISLIFNKLPNPVRNVRPFLAPGSPGITVFSIPDPGIHKIVQDYHLYYTS